MLPGAVKYRPAVLDRVGEVERWRAECNDAAVAGADPIRDAGVAEVGSIRSSSGPAASCDLELFAANVPYDGVTGLMFWPNDVPGWAFHGQPLDGCEPSDEDIVARSAQA